MRRTWIMQDDRCKLILVAPDEEEMYPITFESRCLACHAVVATTVYEEDLHDTTESQERIERDGLAVRLVSAMHRCAGGA